MEEAATITAIQVVNYVEKRIMEEPSNYPPYILAFEKLNNRDDDWEYTIIMERKYAHGSLLYIPDYIEMYYIRKACVNMFGPIIYKKNYKTEINLTPYMKLKRYQLLPGPPQWNGPEGGCLGLPTDVAKLILKWI